MQYFPTAATITTNDYPYGRLRCSATFGTEFKPSHGFRSTFQTVNPKTQRINKPKFGTYYALSIMRQDENGRVTHTCLHDFSGRERMTAGLKLMAAHWDLFTQDEREFLGAKLLLHLKVDCEATIRYAGVEREACRLLYGPSITVATQIFKTGLFQDIPLDWDAIEALKPKDYNPFTVTTQIIG